MSKLYFKLDNEMEEKLEETYEKMQVKISELNKIWNTIPIRIREQLNAQFNENYTPDHCLRWLERSVDDMYRNSEAIFQDLKDNLEDEEDEGEEP